MVDPKLESMADTFGPAPGAVLQVNGPDFEYLQSRGFSDVENQTPMAPDDLFEIGSNTKMFTAVLFMQEAEDNNLLLDDLLAKWLPDWAQKIPNGDTMTLRQLATHTSGIWDYADTIIGAGEKDDTVMKRYYSPGELIQYAIDNGEPSFSPGEEGRWKYSNTGYILLGLVI
jgi:CubicO group peptidase (beta-lactamase class C family)